MTFSTRSSLLAVPRCDYVSIAEDVVVSDIAIGFRKDSPYKQLVTAIILHMKLSGQLRVVNGDGGEGDELG